MKKVLFVSHVANFIKFNSPFMKWFKDMGWEVHYASLGEEPIINCDKEFKVCFNRTVFHKDNIKAYSQIKKIIDDGDYDIIHCHTPIGAALTRFAARKARKKGTKVIYTAHGFAFWKGAPKKDWLIYYNAEKFLSRFTDILVLINDEDYNAAISHKFRSGKIYKIDGVGFNTDRFFPSSSDEKSEKRKKLGIPLDEYLVLYAAEFIPRKNHIFLLDALKKMRDNGLKIRYAFLGKGKLLEEMKERTKALGLSDYVDFFGYRRDAELFYSAADMVAAPGSQEGLPVHILEAMASGLPVAATSIRGHVDLIKDGRNGYLYEFNDMDVFCSIVEKFMNNSDVVKLISDNNIEDVKKYSVENAVKNMAEIYKTVM